MLDFVCLIFNFLDIQFSHKLLAKKATVDQVDNTIYLWCIPVVTDARMINK